MGEYNLRTIKEEFKKKGIFYTPTKLAEMIRSFAPNEPRNVYDPTCGDGSLLSVFPSNIQKYGQEINEQQLNIAKERLENFTGYCGDTLKNPEFKDMKFSCIVANPPFSINWEPIDADERFKAAPALPPKSKADYAFILHILHYLSEDGIAVVLGFPGILYRGNSEGKIRKWLIDEGYIEKVLYIPPDTFVDTKIATCCLVLSKKKSQNIEFVDTEKNITRVVGYEEIQNNSYCLSVSAYIQEDVIKEEVDPIGLEMLARKNMLKKLRADLSMSLYACGDEQLDMNQYLCDIQNLINEFKSLAANPKPTSFLKEKV